jgi:hypothetical protein
LLRQHGIHYRPGAVVDPLEIDLDDLVELILGHVLQLAVHDYAGIVYEAINAPPFRYRGRDHAGKGLDVTHVDHIAKSVTPCLLAHPDRFLYPLRRQVANDDLGTFLGEFDGCSLPYAPAGAGDDCYFVLKPHWSFSLELPALTAGCGAQFN